MDSDVFELAEWIVHSGDYEPTTNELEAMRQRYTELRLCNCKAPNDAQVLATALLAAVTAA
jgi:hypothetical protein